jgi:hypothetical protein
MKKRDQINFAEEEFWIKVFFCTFILQIGKWEDRFSHRALGWIWGMDGDWMGMDLLLRRRSFAHIDEMGNWRTTKVASGDCRFCGHPLSMLNEERVTHSLLGTPNYCVNSQFPME